MMNYVCAKDCPERSPTCHCTCQKYLTAQAKHNAEREKRNAQKRLEAGITESEMKLYRKYEKRRNK